MAIALTARGTINSSTDASSYATAAFTPSANVLLVACYAVHRGGSTNPTTPTVSGHGTWTTANDFLYLATGIGRGRLFVCGTDTGATPGSAAVTFDQGGVTQLGAEASVFELSGTDLTSSGGSSTVAQCFVQAPNTTANATGTSGAVTLAAAGNANNRPFSWWSHAANEVTAPATGWTEVDDLAHAAPANGSESQWHATTFDTAAAASWVGSVAFGGIAFEIKALAAAVEIAMSVGHINIGF